MAQQPRLSSQLYDLSMEKESLACVFLTDGSGSIDGKDFEGPMKQGLQFLAQNFSGAHLSLLQFSSNVKHECPFTTNTAIFTESVQSGF